MRFRLYLYNSGIYLRMSGYGAVAVFCVVLSALVMVRRFRPRTLLSYFNQLGRNPLSPFFKMDLESIRHKVQ